MAASELPARLLSDASIDGSTEDGVAAWSAGLAPWLLGGAWVGSAGTGVHHGWSPGAKQPGIQHPFALLPVELPPEEARAHDLGFCRQTLAPLLHGAADRARYLAGWWQAYRRVNRRFADGVAAAADAQTLVWVHGPQLTGVGGVLRGRWQTDGRPALAAPGLAHHLHSPFPPLDVFLALPWRRELLAALLGYDLLGFESRRDLAHFSDCLAALRADCDLDGDGGVARVRCGAAAGGMRSVRLAVLPTGVDFATLDRRADTPEVIAAARRLRAAAGRRRLLVAVDPLDRSRGLLEKLAGFAALLAGSPRLARRVQLVQAVEPAAVGSPATDELRAEIERRVGEINGRFSHAGCAAVSYLHRRLGLDERLALFRAADLVLSTPLADGSARAALEAVAARPDGDGVLVLSELSAAADRLAPSPGEGAVTLHPHDLQGMPVVLHRALALPEDARRRRMQHLREVAAHDDLGAWIARSCSAAGLSPRAVAEPASRRPPRRAVRRAPLAVPVATPA